MSNAKNSQVQSISATFPTLISSRLKLCGGGGPSCKLLDDTQCSFAYHYFYAHAHTITSQPRNSLPHMRTPTPKWATCYFLGQPHFDTESFKRVYNTILITCFHLSPLGFVLSPFQTSTPTVWHYTWLKLPVSHLQWNPTHIHPSLELPRGQVSGHSAPG